MKIEDNRNTSTWAPAIPILEKFIPRIDQKNFVGVRKIVLLDKQWSKGKNGPAAARYVPVEGCKFADIELYIDTLFDLPDEAKQNRMVLSWRLLISLAHELYHHRVRGQKKIKRPKHKQEEKNADQWAMKIMTPIFIKVYPADRYSNEWDRIEEKIKEYRMNKI